MSMPLLSVRELRTTLFARGYLPIPIYSDRDPSNANHNKRPKGSEWQTVARALTSESVAVWPDADAAFTGVLCDGLQCVDIDTDNAELAEWICDLAKQTLGNAPVRFRSNSPRRLLVYASQDIAPGSSRVNSPAMSKASPVVEVLGRGKQFVAYGQHKSGVEYEWLPGCDLRVVQRDQLTIVAKEQVDSFCEQVATRVGGTATRSMKREYVATTASGAVPIPTKSELNVFNSVLSKKVEELRLLRDTQGRNPFFNNAVLELAEMCSGWGCDMRLMESRLMQAMDENGSITDNGLHAAENTFKSAFNRGWAQPRARMVDLPDIDISRLKSPLVQSTPVVIEKPRPLRRAMANANPFPVESLGPFSWATFAIADKVQCPPAIAAMAVLGVASLAAQAHCDVLLPKGGVKPLSLFLVTVGESGERKSAADNEAKRAISEYERDLTRSYEIALQPFRNARDAWESERQRILRDGKMDQGSKQRALDGLIEPIAPLTPILTCPEPTFEGLCQLFSTGHGALGLFSDEGGHFVGGHGMSNEAKLRTVGGLSSLWDGSPIKRVRIGKGETYVLPGRRLAMHLMLQPKIAAGLFSDPVLKDQGLLARVLVSFPQSTVGTRFQREDNPNSQAWLDNFAARLRQVVQARPMTTMNKPNELTPRQLQFDTASHAVWVAFTNKVETQLAEFGRYESIRGLANKLPEHAARIAGVMTLFEDFYATSIKTESLERGIMLAEHFANEALRLMDVGLVSPEIAIAEQLLEWLTTKWTETFVSTRAIYQFGPNAIRDAKTAKAAIKTLEEHGWVVKAPAGTIVKGTAVNEAWQIYRESA